MAAYTTLSHTVDITMCMCEEGVVLTNELKYADAHSSLNIRPSVDAHACLEGLWFSGAYLTPVPPSPSVARGAPGVPQNPLFECSMYMNLYVTYASITRFNEKGLKILLWASWLHPCRYAFSPAVVAVWVLTAVHVPA
jgi:hypothetical protein